jgi:hypothetical protein
MPAARCSVYNEFREMTQCSSWVAAKVTRQLEILALRALQLADQVAAGEIAFLEAVDLAYDAPLRSGLPAAIDRSGLTEGTKATLAAAFANARRP